MECSQKVMIVDDDKNVRNTLQHVLDDYGFQVICCENGTEAFLCSIIEAFDYIITDYNMPGMDGLELTRRFRKKIPLAIIIGMSGSDMGVEFLSAGANDFFQKPFDPNSLAMTIDGRNILA